MKKIDTDFEILQTLVSLEGKQQEYNFGDIINWASHYPGIKDREVFIRECVKMLKAFS